jgi:BirA family transcriptional regulator, biotin operon repressor / biotin---[acetyl-CoA-carboxylase] ligase
VNHSRFPDELAAIATSLRIASGRIQSRLEIFLEFVEQFENLFTAFEKDGPAVVIEEWTKSSSFANGRRIKVDDGFRIIEGVTRGLNSYGALRVESKDGKIEDVYSGDVLVG